jgi:alkanesulfonate monooxygenase SsuD/methylene tetrahydromethanopterin reductase-like flavin-dependent oxidoreductase (luciferase family)
VAERIPVVREAARSAGRASLPIAGLAYVLPTEDAAAMAEGQRLLTRYYGPGGKPFHERVITGSTAEVQDAVAAYADAGLDVLHLLLASTSIHDVELLARDVLPAFAS